MAPNIYYKVTIFQTSKNSKMVQDRAIVTTADQYKFVYDLPIGTIFNHLKWPLPPDVKDTPIVNFEY